MILLSIATHAEKEKLLAVMFFFLFLAVIFRILCIYLWAFALSFLLRYRRFPHDFTISALVWLGFLFLLWVLNFSMVP